MSPLKPVHRAHLVIWLDLAGAVPRVVDVGIYGEPSPTTTSFLHHYPVELTHSRGSTFDNAVENLKRYVSGMPHMRWALAHFPKPTPGAKSP